MVLVVEVLSGDGGAIGAGGDDDDDDDDDDELMIGEPSYLTT